MKQKNFITTVLILFIIIMPIMMLPAKGNKEDPSQEQKPSSIETSAAAESEKPEGMIAQVNDFMITQEAFDEEYSRMEQALAQSGRPVTEADRGEMETVVIEGIISRHLLYEASRDKGYLAEDESIEEQYASISGQFPDEESFAQALSAQNLTPEILKEELKRGLSIQRLLEEDVNSSVSVSSEEKKTYYEENQDIFLQPEMVKASHIITMASAEDEEAVKKAALAKITEIQEKLNQGADFAETAMEFSEGPSNTQGGDLGFFARGQMVPEFEETAFSLSPGEVSGIVQTDFGYHLIKVVEKQEAAVVPYENVENDIGNFLTEQKTNTAIEQYIEDLKAKADIIIF